MRSQLRKVLCKLSAALHGGAGSTNCSANGLQRGSEVRAHPPQAPGSYWHWQAERARCFFSEEAPRFTLSRSREPTPSSVLYAERHGQGMPALWSVLRATGQWEREHECLQRVTAQKLGHPGATGRGSRGELGSQVLGEWPLQKALGRGPAPPNCNTTRCSGSVVPTAVG